MRKNSKIKITFLLTMMVMMSLTACSHRDSSKKESSEKEATTSTKYSLKENDEDPKNTNTSNVDYSTLERLLNNLNEQIN